MIDLHSHVLPGLDDGAADLEEAVQMCRLAAADGIRTLLATPHFYCWESPPTSETIGRAIERLRAALTELSIELEILPGAEVAMDLGLVDLARSKALPCLGLQERYFLLEMAPGSATRGLEELIYNLGLAGYTPVIAHPERTWPDMKDWFWLQRLVEMGCPVQVTSHSLTGAFGRQVQLNAQRLLELGCCHLVASDAHSASWRQPMLNQARQHLEGLLGADEASLLVESNPAQILAGREPDFEISLKPKKSWLSRFRRGGGGEAA